MTRPDLTVVPEPSRLRVITAGDVGNVHSRLGAGGFDVVAVVDTEADLVVAVSASEPDAIVVDADLCESLEQVREIAPDATLIVVGDHTPAGALGHIDRGVSGTVLAGLLNALAAGGATAAIAIPGFVLAPTPPPPAPAAFGLGQAVTAGLVGAIVVAGVALGLVTSEPKSEERTSAPPSPPPVEVTSPEPPPVAEPVEEPSPSPRPERSPSVEREVAPPPPAVSPTTQTSSPEPPPPPPPAEEPSPAAHPPGHAHGWDNRPPKTGDHGRHTGWDKGHGPKP